MASIVKGTIYADGDTVTSANLLALVTAATVSSIDRGDFSTTAAKTIYRGSSPPSTPRDGEMWEHSTTTVLRWYDLATDIWYPVSSWTKRVTLAAGTGALSAGHLVVPWGYDASTGILTVRIAPTGWLPYAVLGVAASDIEAEGTGLIVMRGAAKIKTDGTVTYSDGLELGAADGIATAGNKPYGNGTFGIALQTESGGYTWALLRR